MSNVVHLFGLEFDVDADEPTEKFSAELSCAITRLCQAAAEQWLREHSARRGSAGRTICRVQVHTSEALVAALADPDAFEVILTYKGDNGEGGAA
jgi:hypothetical protein